MTWPHVEHYTQDLFERWRRASNGRTLKKAGRGVKLGVMPKEALVISSK